MGLCLSFFLRFRVGNEWNIKMNEEEEREREREKERGNIQNK